MLLRPSKETSVPGLEGLGRGEDMSCQALQTKERTWTVWEVGDEGSHWEWSTRSGQEEKKWHLRGRTDRTWRLVNTEGKGAKGTSSVNTFI